MKKLIRSTVIIMNLILVSYTGMAFADESKVIYEQCFINKVKNIKIGYSCTLQKEKQDNDRRLIVTSRYSEQEFKRFGFSIKIVQDLQFVEDDKGNPVSFSAKVESLGDNINIQGEFSSPDQAAINSVINGVKKSEQVSLKRKIYFPYAVNQLFKNNTEEQIEYSTVDPTTDFRIVTIKAEKIGSELLPEDNLSGEYVKYKVTMDLLPNIGNFQWVDKEGRIVKEKSSILGLEEVAVPKDKIAAKVDDFDILFQSLIPINTEIADPSVLDVISYKIETQNVNPEELFISDNRQRILQIKDKIAYLKIKNENLGNEKFKYPVNTRGQLEYLKSGPFIISDNEDIKNQANILVAQEKDAYKIAKKMEKWVFDNITNKDFSVNFANSTQVLKSREGDCTEHSILLAALLRAAGIPSQVVVGLMYTNTPEKAFGYHMWVKAYVGEWVNLDPSFPGEGFTPVHIAMHQSALNSLTDRSDAVLNIIKSLSNLKIHILNQSTSQQNNLVDIKVSKKDSNSDAIKVLNLAKNNSSESVIKKISVKNNEDSSTITNIELEKKTAEDYIGSAFYNFSKGKIADCKNDFNKAAQLIPFNDDYSEINLAVKEFSLGLFNEANKKFKTTHDPEIWDPYIKTLKRIYFPKVMLSEDAESILAEVQSRIENQSDPDGAVKLINKNLSALQHSDYTHYLLSKAYFAKKNTDKSLIELNKAVRINPDNLTYHLELAKLYTQKNNFKKAAAEYKYIQKQKVADDRFMKLVTSEETLMNHKAVKNNKQKSQYHMAKYHSLNGEFQSSLSILEKLVSGKCKDADVYVLLGNIYLAQAQEEKAKESYLTALKYNKSKVDALTGISILKRIEGKNKESLNILFKALKLEPDSAEILMDIADNYKLLSQEEYTYRYYLQALKYDSNNPKVNYKLGLMYVDMNDLEKAGTMFRKSLSLNPKVAQIWIELAKLEIKKKNYFLAKTYLIPVNSMDQRNYNYYYYLGLINKNNENYSEARANFKKAVELNPSYTEAIEELKQLS